MAGEAQWERVFQELIDAFTPNSETMLAALIAVEEVIADGFQGNFFNQLDDAGRPWAPRKDSKPHPLLIKTGRMFKAATDTADSNHFSDIEGTTLTTGISDSGVRYAKFHMTGTRRMPARRVIYATPQTLNRAAERFGDVVEGKLRGA